jgi:signal transduction histidine kinase/ligand-binding sensor domain-containing protein
MTRVFWLIWLSVASTAIYAQAPAYRQYSVSDGVPSSEVYEVYQDKEGFVWLATDNGISKFNGSEFENFHVKDGLTDPVVFGFQEDGAGKVWLRTFSGKLCYLENGKFESYKYNSALSDLIEQGLLNFEYFDDTKELWFSIRNTYGKIDSLGNMQADKIIQTDVNHGVNYIRVRDKGLIVLTSPGRVGNEKVENTFVIDGKTFTFNPAVSAYTNRVMRKIVWMNNLYFSMHNSIVRYDGNRIHIVHNAAAPIISLTTDKSGNLWVGYMNGGASRFSNDTFTAPWTLDFLSTKSVTYVKETTDGALWFSTLENGVYVVPNPEIQNYQLPTDAPIKTVGAAKDHVLVADKSGTIWIYDKQSKLPLEKPKIIRDVLTFHTDKNSNIWIFGGSALTVLTKDLKHIKDQHDMNAVDVHEDENGEIISLGTQRIHRFDSDLDQIEVIRLRALYREFVKHDTAFFLAGRIGLNISDQNFKHVRAVPDFETYKISELISLNDSTLFVATIGSGFFFLNTRTGRSQHYDESNFLANNIHAAAFLPPELWLGTEKGLVKSNVDSIMSGKPLFHYINAHSGLEHDIVYHIATVNNEIWAFSNNTFSVVPRSFSKFSNTRPSFYIKEVTCNNEPVNIDAPLIFDPSQNNIKIRFGFISFTNNNIKLRYRINDSEVWNYSDDKVFQFASLASGRYRFSLQYTTDSHYWHDTFTPLTFEIKAPWYRRWYVYPIASLLLLAAAFVYVRNRQAVYAEKNRFLEIINDHQQKLIQSQIATIERERNRIAKELHDGVGTNLTAIKLSVHQLLTTNENPLADDIEEQFQHAIADLKNLIYDLTPPSLERYGLFVALKNYINKIGKNIPINIQFKTFGSDINDINIGIIVFRIAQELLSNSIKHSDAKNITVHMNSFEDLLNIIYEDDGVGFTYNPEQSGLGLDNVESRVRSLNGTLKFDSGKFGVSYNIDIPLKEIKKESI